MLLYLNRGQKKYSNNKRESIIIIWSKNHKKFTMVNDELRKLEDLSIIASIL